MKLLRLWICATLPLALLACGDDDGLDEGPLDREPDVEVEETAVAPAPPPVVTGDLPTMDTTEVQMVQMVALENSGVTGQALLTPRDRQTQVMVRLLNLPDGGHAGHIHEGTCDNIGRVVEPLEDIAPGADRIGTMTTTVSYATMVLMHEPHLIAYHRDPGNNHGPTIVCGEIPRMAM